MDIVKREKNKLVCRVHTRITAEKYAELSGMLSRSVGIQSLSELVRNILSSKPIAVKSYDNSLDKIMEELSLIRKELLAIGVNINQVTHRFHIEQLPEVRLVQALEIAKLYQQTEQKVSSLFTLIAKLSEAWL